MKVDTIYSLWTLLKALVLNRLRTRTSVNSSIEMLLEQWIRTRISIYAIWRWCPNKNKLIEAKAKWLPFRRHFQIHFLEWKCIWLKFSLIFVPKVRINNTPTLVQIKGWCRPGDKPLSEPMVVRWPMHICVTRLQWVNLIVSHIFFVSRHKSADGLLYA